MTIRKRRRRSRTFGVGMMGVFLAAMLAFAVPAVANHVATDPPSGLEGSDFEILDGNTVVNTAPHIDWDSVDADVKSDKPTGSQDDSFGQGTKEDTAVPTVVDGSIPPNKSDLKEFGFFVEKNSNGNFLNLFWTRVQDPTGTTNMDFEFNQNICTEENTSGCSSNGKTPIRKAGDLLITYDLSRGGTVATISKRTWSGTAWGPSTDLGEGATGSINTSAITTNINGVAGSYSARTFGEASVDLSLIFNSGSCVSFGGAYLKSRSSDSFTSAVKDFIAPIGVGLTNCGRLVVNKTDGSGPLAGAAFTISPANSAPAPTSAMVEVDTGVFCIDSLLIGTSYTVHESTVPPGYDGAADQAFSPSQVGSCAMVTASTPADLTFVNQAKRGAIAIAKTAKNVADAAAGGDGVIPVGGAEFEVTDGDGNVVGSGMTDSNGELCIGDLPLASYTVSETGVPAGYGGGSAQSLVVDSQGTCSSGAESVSFDNTPLSNITVSFASQVAGGTAAKISCTGLDATPEDETPSDFDDESETFEDLEPGTYSCTVVIDP